MTKLESIFLAMKAVEDPQDAVKLLERLCLQVAPKHNKPYVQKILNVFHVKFPEGVTETRRADPKSEARPAS